ncbi:hypothetical protein HDU83_007181 [Entophlyctis luteolus]|nr:hypothetical protein HDU83_007181 [Entophlyctis luteolus]KAJ3378695.1 hypothetical protein HDU84_007352 [Entophlyctis sp. JEL0112]
MSLVLFGVGFAWTVELAFGTPLLTTLGMGRAGLALVWLAGPLSGLIAQPVVGVWSDALGARKPFIAIGAAAMVLATVCVCFSPHLAPSSGSDHSREIIVVVVGFYILDFAINAVTTCCRSLIVDASAPEDQAAANLWGIFCNIWCKALMKLFNRNASLFSALGTSLGYWMGFLDLPVLMKSFLGDSILFESQLSVLGVFCICLMAVTTFITCTLQKLPKPEIGNNDGFDSETARIPKVEGISTFRTIVDGYKSLTPTSKAICMSHGVSLWLTFCQNYRSSSWVASKHPAMKTSPTEAIRAGSYALLWNSVLSFLVLAALPQYAAKASRFTSSGRTSPVLRGRVCNSPHALLSLPRLWAFALVAFCLMMLATWFVSTVNGATVIVAAVGIPWGNCFWAHASLVVQTEAYETGIISWIPFALLSEEIARLATSSQTYELLQEVDDRRTHSTHLLSEAGTARSGAVNAATNAGLILGIHNIHITVPQLLSTFVTSAVFWSVDWSQGGVGESKDDAYGVCLRVGAVFVGAAAWILVAGERRGVFSVDVRDD